MPTKEFTTCPICHNDAAVMLCNWDTGEVEVSCSCGYTFSSVLKRDSFHHIVRTQKEYQMSDVVLGLYSIETVPNIIWTGSIPEDMTDEILCDLVANQKRSTSAARVFFQNAYNETDQSKPIYDLAMDLFAKTEDGKLIRITYINDTVELLRNCEQGDLVFVNSCEWITKTSK